ncbi:YheV family putative metal-binding protein [Aliidiomarina halalkaliphila]|uniref:YheV family putative metal-binding protein n=1 Tax=Aliidiomarina halalkaliphila TaxID=2593535 RepID=A0A552X256_9GAMM|nr:YheV family putative zinc ribbon protein [Aliidiomarina halalkaliphila]TRW49036.1 YheV family putative metal-binding protein [Aliidiomarina halalkaliphila]
MTRTRKRFIAGAVCPSCKAEDSLMVYMEENKEHVRCVECDYHMSEDDHAQDAQENTKGKAAVKRDQVIGVFKPDEY